MGTTVTSREFNQHPSRAKQAAENDPVFITDRGEPSHVLLSIGEYRRIVGKRMSLLEAFAIPEADEIDFDIPEVKGRIAVPAEFE